MACTTQRGDALADLAAGRLDATELDDLLGHVETCPECSRELDLVAALTSAPGRAAGAALRLRLLPRIAIAAAAVFLAWAGFGLWFGTGGESAVERAAQLARLDPLPAAVSELRGSADRGDLRAAMDAYGGADWEVAVRRFAALEADRERPDAQLVALYLGLSYAQLPDDQAALAAFDRARAGGVGLTAERAAWYRVNVLLRMGQVERAHSALGAIRAAAGEYELNAEALLAAIDALGGR